MDTSNLTTQELLTILEVTRHLAEQHEMQPLIDYAATTIFDLVAAERCLIVLFAEDGTPQVQVARDQQGSLSGNISDQISRSILNRARTSLAPIVVNDALEDSAFKQAQSVRSLKLRSVMCAPLISRGRAIGAIYVENRSASGRFGENNLLPLILFANQVVGALENARVVEALQHELDARARAEQALLTEHARVLQLKNEFMATMSHELRTPLNAVLGHAQLLIEEVYGPLNARQQMAVQRVEESGRNLLSLINDILDYAKFEAGQVALDLAPTEVASVCSASMHLVVPSAQAKLIAITSTLDAQVEVINADARRLQQILVNLLTNAIKFTPEGGEVGLEVRGDAAREQVVFTVWDTGIGIAEADVARLFQSFTQLDSKLSRQYEGTGLGLALVRRLAEAHSGSVSVASALGQGSRFSVSLPWAAAGQPSAGRLPKRPEPERAEPSSAALSSAAPVILLVEDHESNIRVIQDMLSAHGYDLMVARDGSEGLACARATPPALVLMDIQLPGMSGIEAIQQMRADARLLHTPVIALTALVMPGDRERCLQAGADEYLPKPVSARTLLGAIARLI